MGQKGDQRLSFVRGENDEESIEAVIGDAKLGADHLNLFAKTGAPTPLKTFVEIAVRKSADLAIAIAIIGIDIAVGIRIQIVPQRDIWES